MKTIFVSSTFQDMQLERDALQRLSLPGINAMARAYADKVAMCDLRWGSEKRAMPGFARMDSVFFSCRNRLTVTGIILN